MIGVKIISVLIKLIIFVNVRVFINCINSRINLILMIFKIVYCMIFFKLLGFNGLVG